MALRPSKFNLAVEGKPVTSSVSRGE
jgi:hypothetical protein